MVSKDTILDACVLLGGYGRKACPQHFTTLLKHNCRLTAYLIKILFASSRIPNNTSSYSLIHKSKKHDIQGKFWKLLNLLEIESHS